MATIDDAGLNDLIHEIHNLVRSFGGGNSSPIGNNQNKAGTPIHKHIKTAGVAIKQFHGGVDGMIGGMKDLVYHMGAMGKGFAGLSVAAGLLVGAFESVLNVGKTYSKMTDIGQNFNGSLLTMMESAGKAGMSLSEYSKFLGKNSMATAAVGAKAMGQFQLAIRNNLESVGFYGMSMEELTGATSDYTETLRETGNLFRRSETDRAKSFQNMIGQASALSGVFGRSREEILKTVNDQMRQTNLAARLSISTQSQTEAAQKFITMFAGANPELAKVFAEQLGRGGYVKTALGNAAIASGMGQFNDIMNESIQTARNGGPVTEETTADSMIKMARLFTPEQIERLENMNTPEADQLLEVGNKQLALLSKYAQRDATGRITGYDRERLIQDQKDAKAAAEIKQKLTRDALTFESAFHQVTGSFLEGFYGTLASVMGGEGSKTLTESLKGLGVTFGMLGRAAGSVIAVLFSSTALRIYSDFASTVGSIVSVLGSLLSGLSKFMEKIMGWIGLGDGKGPTAGGTIATIATLVIGWMLASRFKNFFFGKSAAAVAAEAAGGGLLRKIPGVRRLFGGKAGAAAGAMAGLADGSCCEGMASGLGDLAGKVDTHGKAATTAAEDTAKAAEAGAKGTEKAAAKAGGSLAEKAGLKTAKLASGAAAVGSKTLKTALKLLPGIGLAMGGVFAAQRALEGDFLGATGEIVGGFASLVPGIGTAVDASIQAGLLARDLAGHDETSSFFGGVIDAIKNFGGAAPGSPNNPLPTNAYGPPVPTPEAPRTVAEQLAALNKQKEDLEAARAFESNVGDQAAADRDSSKIAETLTQIRDLTAQQTKMQKDQDEKDKLTAAAAATYGMIP